MMKPWATTSSHRAQCPKCRAGHRWNPYANDGLAIDGCLAISGIPAPQALGIVLADSTIGDPTTDQELSSQPSRSAQRASSVRVLNWCRRKISRK